MTCLICYYSVANNKISCSDPNCLSNICKECGISLVEFSHKENEIYNVDSPDNIIAHPGNDMPLGDLGHKSINAPTDHSQQEEYPNQCCGAYLFKLRSKLPQQFFLGVFIFHG